MTGFPRGAALALLLATASLVGGCGGGGGTEADWVPGNWSGSLTLSYQGGGTDFGAFSAALDQEESFVSGIAEWAPASDTLSIAGPIDGSDLTLRLNFRCIDIETDALRPFDAVLEATVDGDSMRISGGSGYACPGGGAAIEVTGATGTLTRLPAPPL